MKPDWTTIHTSANRFEVSIKQMSLEDEGIETLIFDQQDSSYGAFGYFYLQVDKKNVERAEKILKEISERDQ